jgi:hypothetical protein
VLRGCYLSCVTPSGHLAPSGVTYKAPSKSAQSCNVSHSNLCERPVRMSALTPAILILVVRGFLQSLQADIGLLHQIRLPFTYRVIYYSLMILTFYRV